MYTAGALNMGWPAEKCFKFSRFLQANYGMSDG